MIKETKNIIEFVNVEKSYSETEALKDISFNIPEGSFTVLIGSSGSGKTTALKMVNYLIKPTKGKVLIDGKDISSLDVIKLRRSIGYVIQASTLFPHLNVKQNILYVPNLIAKMKKNDAYSLFTKLINTVGLDADIENKYPHELSGGQQQRVGIARALAVNPRILLMDEPFSSVDEITRGLLQEELLRLHKVLNITILFVTHDIEEALKLGDQIIVMHSGSIEQIGSPSDIINNPKSSFVSNLTKKCSRF